MRWAICNEIFDDRPLDKVFSTISSVGFDGVELAPFTLAGEPLRLSASERREIRGKAADAGLAITGLHWLLARTEGLHISDPTPNGFTRTLNYLRGLSKLCADLHGNVLVFGSPDQRSTPPGMAKHDAESRAIEMLTDWSSTAEDLGVTICLEALPRDETDFMNTTAEVIEIVEAISSPAVKMVLDVKSMCSETTPIPELVRRAAPHLAYFQANDANRGGPGFGDTDFVPIFRALAEIRYRGDVSVEAFEVNDGPDDLALRSFEYLRSTAALAGFPDPEG